MKNHRVDYSLATLCRCFKVSRSGFYAWLNRKPSAGRQQRQAFDQRVKGLFLKHKHRYTHRAQVAQNGYSENCLKRMEVLTI